MSAQWTRKKAEAAAAIKPESKSAEPPPADQPSQPEPAPTPPKAADVKLSPADWNLIGIPDLELWAALIWEYGRSAVWIHGRLPQHDLSNKVERDKQIARFHSGDPSPALKLLNNMRLWQWCWSQNNAVHYVDFFSQDVSWERLPQVVRANMCRAVDGLEPAVDLVRLRDLLADSTVDDGGSPLDAAKIMDQLTALEPSPPTIDEEEFVNEPQAWLPGGNGLDDVTASVINGEEQIDSLRKTLEQLLRNKISPATAQEQLQRAWSHEISLARFRDDPVLRDAGYFAVAFRGNFHLKREDLIKKFGQWLDDAWPNKFSKTRKGKRSTTRGPKGLVLNKADGNSVEPATALKQLGTWRILQAAGSPKDAIACYWPNVSGRARAAKEVEISRDHKAAEDFFVQLFPHPQS